MIFHYFDSLTFLSPTSLFWWRSISKTIRFCRVKVWTDVPSFMKISCCIQKLSWDIPKTGRQPDRCHKVELKLTTCFACIKMFMKVSVAMKLAINMTLEKCLLHTSTPVSYTHLDVYKRQGQGTITRTLMRYKSD